MRGARELGEFGSPRLFGTGQRHPIVESLQYPLGWVEAARLVH